MAKQVQNFHAMKYWTDHCLTWDKQNLCQCCDGDGLPLLVQSEASDAEPPVEVATSRRSRRSTKPVQYVEPADSDAETEETPGANTHLAGVLIPDPVCRSGASHSLRGSIAESPNYWMKSAISCTRLFPLLMRAACRYQLKHLSTAQGINRYLGRSSSN